MAEEVKIARIEVDREACISVASCVEIAPENFELDEDGKARFITKDGKSDIILEAARSCHVEAIKVYDENGKQIWPPKKEG